MENHLQGEAAGPDNETQGTQAPTTNTNMTNGPIPFQNPREVYPIQLVLQFQVAIDIHSHPTRDWVRRLPGITIHSLPFQLYLHKPMHIPRAEI